MNRTLSFGFRARASLTSFGMVICAFELSLAIPRILLMVYHVKNVGKSLNTLLKESKECKGERHEKQPKNRIRNSPA